VKLTAAAAAKINLALVVGERRADGHHEVATVLQRIDICDRIELEPAATLAVDGFRRDTLVSAALTRLAAAADTSPRWRVCLRKQIPIAAGLGGGSADAAAALTLANATLSDPLDDGSLHELAATLGADVPFFLRPGPKLAEGAGERLSPLDLPQDFWVLLALPRRAKKGATGDIYRAFPPKDLAPVAAGSVAFADQLRALGAFRADVSGAGPAVYGLFQRREHAVAAARRLRLRARVWVTAPVW
jgi:4-diphosphocytidyl-2-C-methyl-D-erythritol kinase